MTKFLDGVAGFLTRDNRAFERTGVMIETGSRIGDVEVNIFFYELGDLGVCGVNLDGIDVPIPMLLPVMELIIRLNQRVHFGQIGLNPDERLIVSRASMSLSNGKVTDDDVEILIGNAIGLSGLILSKVHQVLDGARTPAEAAADTASDPTDMIHVKQSAVLN